MKHRPLVALAVLAVVVAALIVGFAAETESLFDQFWLGMITLIAPLLLLLTVALAATLRGRARLLTAVSLGVAAGCFSGIAFALGAFSPFALELGGRELNELGGDLAWDVSLVGGLIIWGGGGAVLGAVSGTAAWIFWVSLGRRSSDRQPDATEAGR